MNRVYGSSLLAIGIGLGFATAAQAQNQYQQQITNQLTAAASTIRGQGYNADRAPLTGSLNDDTEETLMVNLTGGVRYAILGVCDNDCSDVDLQLFSGDGTKIAEDLATDDHPVVTLVAQYTGQYRLKVLMPACRTNPCYYGVQVFVR